MSCVQRTGLKGTKEVRARETGRIIRATSSEDLFFREAALRRRNSLGKLVYVSWN